MYGCILTPPNDEEGDFGILFLHNEGYSTMCGHAIIALTKFAFETGMIVKEIPELIIDAPPLLWVWGVNLKEKLKSFFKR